MNSTLSRFSVRLHFPVLLFAALFSLAIVGCDTLFEAEVDTNVSPDDFERAGYPGAELMVRGAFDRMANAMDNAALYGAVATDEANEHSGQVSYAELDLGTWNATGPEMNFLYAGLHDARGHADRFINEFLGRFDLALNYEGEVPIETREQTMITYSTLLRGWSTLYLGLLFEEVNFDGGPAQPAEDAIRRAVEDLEAVVASYDDSSAPEEVFEGIHLEAAAHTLLAKAYLQLGEYDAAVAAAEEGYAQGEEDDYVVFYNSSGADEVDGNAVYSFMGDASAANKSAAMTSYYIETDAMDERIAVSDGDDTFIVTAKNDRADETAYELGYDRPHELEKYLAETVQDSPMRLLSWQDNTLTRAEALIRRGDVDDGVEALNDVRSTVSDGSGNALSLSDADGESEALDAILLERRHEFAVEQGDRFITFRRFGIMHEVSGVAHAFPIPITEAL